MSRVIVALWAIAVFSFLAITSPDARAETVRIKVGGLNVNGNLAVAEGGSLADGAILMVHGTLAHNAMDTIKNLQEIITERGVNSLAINLSLGLDDRTGMYDCEKTHAHRHVDALDEIAAWIDWLKSKGANKITLFGHSRGGNQAAWFAAEKGDPALDKVVLLAPATWDEGAARKGFERRHGKPLAEVLEQAADLEKAGKGSEVMEKAGTLYCPEANVTAASFLSYYRPDPRFDSPKLLSKIQVPVLVMAGSDDTVVKGLTEKVEPMADGSRIRFVMIEDADHFFLDLVAEDVADAIEEFSAPEG